MSNPQTPSRVAATPAALSLLAQICADHGAVMFHQSGGCCDGSAPMCYSDGDFMIGDGDVWLGDIGGAPFYISAEQFEFFQHTRLLVDAEPGRGGAFSLDNARGIHFVTKSELYSDEEYQALRPVHYGPRPVAVAA
jgi:uncharacterized protein (DUF779 family)